MLSKLHTPLVNIEEYIKTKSTKDVIDDGFTVMSAIKALNGQKIGQAFFHQISLGMIIVVFQIFFTCTFPTALTNGKPIFCIFVLNSAMTTCLTIWRLKVMTGKGQAYMQATKEAIQKVLHHQGIEWILAEI
jgi:hypothetical protein